MAPSKSLRSNRSADLSSAAPSELPSHPPVTASKPAPKAKKNAKTKGSPVASGDAQLTSSGEGDGEAAAAAESEDEKEDPAPSSDTAMEIDASKTINESSPAVQQPTAKSSTGLPPTSRMNDEMRNEKNDSLANDTPTPAAGFGASMEDMDNYEFSDAGSVSSSTTSVAGLDLEDDDDYNGVDNISNSSDDSYQFEKEVEADLMAEGDAMFDWEDVQTYQYDENWNTGIYDLGHSTMEPMADYDLSHLHHDGRMTQSAPSLPVRSLGDAIGEYPFSSFTEHNSSASSSSDGESPVSSPKTPARRPEPLNDYFDDGDETEEDEPDSKGTVTRPSVMLNRATHPLSRLKSAPPVHDPTADNLPTPREVRVNPNKAIAFTTNGPLGRRILYINPKGRSWKWIVRSSMASSMSNSGASSPTMIDIDHAMFSGNTRSGAVITDLINGAFFRSTHCPQSPSNLHELPRFSRFYQAFSTPGRDLAIDIGSDGPLFGEELVDLEHELVDFEQCDVVSSSSTPITSLHSPHIQDYAVITKVKNTAPSAPRISRPAAADDTPMVEVSASPLSPVTPSPMNMQGLAITSDSTSPRKRRLSDRAMHEPDSVSSPLVKKNRISASSDISA